MSGTLTDMRLDGCARLGMAGGLLLLVACSSGDTGGGPTDNGGGGTAGIPEAGAGGLPASAGGTMGSAGSNTGGASISGGAANGGATNGGAPNGGAPNGGTSGAASGTGGTPGSDGETGRMLGMTAATNAVRHAVSTPPPSPALPDMTWSPDIAKIAQAYADNLASQGCILVHSHTAGYGENIAEFGGKAATPEEVVTAWASEGACYTYGPITANDSCPCTPSSGGACGHYTQVVWRGTTEVGCGVATCPGKEVWVCNYKPPGNILGQKPY